MNKIPHEAQYIYWAICELIDIRTANTLLDSGEILKWATKNPPQPLRDSNGRFVKPKGQ